MKFISKKSIKIERELSDLDLFTIDFLKILEKYSDYVVVSGYVSILLGRARASEDVDLIIPKMDFEKFKILLNELKKRNFYCLNAENEEEIYSLLKEDSAARFAKTKTVIPNMEMKFAKRKTDFLALGNKIKVKLNKYEMNISPLEMQILFKEKILKSPKDMEDARHLRNIASKELDKNLMKEYEKVLNEIC